MEHHAHCIVGDFESAYAFIRNEDKETGPDVLLQTYTQFTIADARALKQASSQRPVERSYRVFIVSLTSATLEAQNALLKLLEEPAHTSRFYIIVPFEDVLIPTVRSRLMIHYVGGEDITTKEVVKAFLSASYSERLTLIAERTKEKDDVWCETLIRGLEQYAQVHEGRGASELIFIERYIRGSGASKKMLLEHLALSL